MSRGLRRLSAGVLCAMTLTGALASGAGRALAQPGSTPAEHASAPAEHASAPAEHASTADPAPALAPMAAAKATVTLRFTTPSVVSPGTTVTVTGTVTAPAANGLPAGQVRVVRGTTRLAARADIDRWAADTRRARGPILGHVSTAALEAGASAPFVITVASGTVRSARAFEAIPISLELTTAETGPQAVAHSFLAWQARKEYEPLTVATLVPVTLDPDVDLFARNRATKARAWRRAIGEGSRVRTLVEETRDLPVTLAVDPAVLGPGSPGTDDAADEGPEPNPPATPTPPPTESPRSTESPGSPLPPATRALTDTLATQLRGRNVWALPYADADLAAAADIDPTDPIVRDLVTRARSLAARLDQRVRSDVAWPVDELLPARREAELKQLYAATASGGPSAIVVRQDAISAASPYTPTALRVAKGGTRLLASDPMLSAELPTAGYAAGLSIQRYLADTLVLLGERPGTPRTVLVTAPRTWNPDPSALASFLAATDVPWLTRVDASTLLDSAQPAPQPEQTPAAPPTPAVPPAALTDGRLTYLETQRQTILRVATVLRDRAGFERTYRELLDELVSVRWRFAPQDWTTLSQTLGEEVRAATSAIKVIPREVNFLAESGILQITVANGLDYEVSDIRLVLLPTNPRMQIVEQPGPITIGAESLTTVRVPVTAVAAGQADIRAILTTADGTPIGQGATIPVSANPLDAEIYWVGGIVAALILVAGVLRTIMRGTSRIEEIDEGIDALTGLAD